MLPTFDAVNQRLLDLINAQDKPTGCQAVYMPNDYGAMYTIQIAFRSPSARLQVTQKFIDDAAVILREGGRRLQIRASRVEAESDHEKMEIITKGYLRLWASGAVGDMEPYAPEPEPVIGLAALRS